MNETIRGTWNINIGISIIDTTETKNLMYMVMYRKEKTNIQRKFLSGPCGRKKKRMPYNAIRGHETVMTEKI